MLKERASVIQDIQPVLILDINNGLAVDIESMLTQYDNEFEVLQKNNIENAIQFLQNSPQIITVLLAINSFEIQESTHLANLAKSFPEKNVIVIANEGRMEHGLEALKLGAADYLFYSDLTPTSLGRIVQYAEQRVQIQQKNQKDLLKSQEWYQDIISKSKDAIYICDLEGQLVDFNKSMNTLFGRSPKELQTSDIHNLMHSSKRRNEFLVRLVAAKKVENFEMEIERKSGERRQCLINARMLESAELIGYTGIIRDITEQKQAEALKKARDIARQSAQLKEQFIASISHEMRTPMNAILGMSNLVLKTNLNTEQFNYISSIKQSSEILLGVVNDILQISEIQNGKVKFENKNFDLHALMKNLINVMQYKSEEKDLELKLVMEEGTPKVIRGDKLRLNQILYNLVGNAVKFTDSGHVKIMVVNLNQNNYSVQIKFMVEDTGIGIPQEKVDAIFESFTRIRTKDRIFEGTGLGLSIAKNLVEQQGGKIGVSSEKNVGSTFYFDLIFEIGDELEKESKRITPTLLPENTSFKLLLVEDHKMNQLVARKTLEKQWKNIDIVIANHGLEAIEILENQPFDIILMDLQMPKMDGYEATQHIRHKMSPEIASLPILVMTAHAHISQDEKFKEYGMDDYVLKPFEPEQLFQKISQYAVINNSRK